MATFLVFRELPGVTRDQYAAAQQAVVDAAGQPGDDDLMLRYLGGFFFPGAGGAVCIFVAGSAADVATVNRRAGVPFTEVLAAIDMRPPGQFAGLRAETTPVKADARDPYDVTQLGSVGSPGEDRPVPS